MKTRVLLTGGTLFLAVRTFGQIAPVPTFEAASIKPSKAGPGSDSGIASVKGRISGRNVTLRRCIRGAYSLPETQILGGPKWVDDERYDIDAKAAGPAGDHDLMIMLQSLLAERFNLAFHREKRPMSGYALLVGKGGLKAQRSAPDTHSSTQARRGGIDAHSSTMANLAQKLSDALHLPVADSTGVEGAFDFKLQWTTEDGSAKPAADAGPSIFAALQEQLGLKLESRKVPTEVLVIDRAEKATEN